MSNRKKFPFRVITATTLAAMFLTTPGYAQIIKENQPTSSKVDANVQGALKNYLADANKEAAKASDQSVYKDINENNSKVYAANEKVRVIVEVQDPEQATQAKSKRSNKALMKQKQDDVVTKMTKKKLSPKIRHRFYEGFNGFSLDTEFKDIKELQATPGVSNVHIARTYEQTMKTSKELVQAQKVWEQYGYEGEGLVVGVIDSGIDYTHRDMTLTEKGKQKEKLTESNIQNELSETSVNDRWYSDKVPTGYDWADKDTDVIPHGKYANPHGTHVSGTIGANGNEENDGVLGIAPGVQLLAEKVFSDSGSVGAYEDDIIAGINHAVEMGADVINMSLGTDSGFVGEEKDPIQKAIREATEHGTLVVVAGGNAAYSTKNSVMGASAQPYAENPDIGTVGEPGVSPFALSVASYENTNYELNTLGEENGLQLPYQDQTQYNFKLSRVLSPNESYELVYVGEGFQDAHYTGKDVNGKIVVFRPNTSYSTYASMQSQAKKRGAKAVILVPAANMADYPYVNLGSNLTPTATTSKAAGNALIDKLNSGQVVKMKVTKGTWVDNPARDTMSYFSSYGAPTTLDFKPEISAPGGKIYSTTPGNEYEVMSGTSMATPHVAGGAALIMQSLYEKGLTHSEDTALKAKIALMNTAKMVMDPKTNNEVPYSPRIQGSGLMQIENAMKTPVIVTRKNTPLEQAGAVALKEIKNDRAIFNLNVESLETKGTKKDYEYTVNVDLLTDGIDTKQFDFDGDGTLESKDYLSLKSTRVEGASIYVNGEKLSSADGATLKIKAGQTKNLNVEIRLPRTLRKNEFVEGFVQLIPTGKNSDTAVPLTVPYMGFNGDWTELNNIDPAAWDRKDAFLGYTALWNDEGASVPMGYDNKTGKFNMNAIATSPNSILKGVFPTFTAFRNLAKAEMYIEDKKGKMIKYLGDFSEYNGGKPYPLRKNILSASGMYMGYNWDAKDQNGNIVTDDTYNFVIKTTLDYPGAKPQKVKLPFIVDSVGPKVSNVQVKPKDGQYEISFDAVDSSSGYRGAILWYNGIQKSVLPGETSVLVNEEPKSVVVMGIDNAMNISYKVWGDSSYVKYTMLVPTFSVTPSANINASKPASIYGFAQTRVNWTIYVKDAGGNIVDSMQVNNEHQIYSKWTPDANLASGTYTISADAVDKEGFKVTTKTFTVTVVK